MILEKGSISWINSLKGIAILAVVLGHINTPLTPFIFSWHMPLFFFLSGYLLNRENLKESIKKDFQKLIIPYFLFGLFAILVEFLKRQFWPNFDFIYNTFSIKEELTSLFLWMDAGKIHTYGFVLWFLPALFWSKNIVVFIRKFVKNDLLLFIIGVGLWFLVVNKEEIWLFGLDKGVMATTWIIFGLLAKKYLDRSWLLVLSLFLVKMPNLNMAYKIALDPGSSLIYPLAIILLLIFLFRKIQITSLSNIGLNSMVIFALHPYTNNFAYLLVEKYWFIEYIVSFICLFVILWFRDVIKKTKYSNLVNWI